MSYILNYNPGQQATLVFENLDGYGERSDGYGVPVIGRIIFPNLSLAAGYPQPMVRLDVGLYIYSFTLPVNASSVGSYIADISYYDPDTGILKATFFQIVVTAPFGNFSATTY